MDGRFIYVFDEQTRDALIAGGYRLMNSGNGMYVFENKPGLVFAMNGMRCVYLDTLTF